MSIKNARILGIRLDAKTTQDLEAFERATHIEGVSLARAALLAALTEYQAVGTLTLPLRIVSAVSEEIPSQPSIPSPNLSPCADFAHLPAPIPSNPSDPTANIVKLPPPPVLATLLHDSIATETPHASSPDLPPRKTITYPKKKRKP